MSQPIDTGNTDPNANVDGSGTTDPNAGAEGTGNEGQQPEVKPEGDEALKKALQQERLRATKAEKALREKELEKLPELERLKTEHAELTKEVEKLTLENRQYKIGMKHKLPLSIAKRLQGDSDEEMDADALEVLKHYKTDDNIDDGKEKKRPPNDGSKSGKNTSGYDMNKLMRIAAGRG